MESENAGTGYFGFPVNYENQYFCVIFILFLFYNYLLFICFLNMYYYLFVKPHSLRQFDARKNAALVKKKPRRRKMPRR